MEAASRPVAYRVEIGSRAGGQLEELDAVLGASIERKIQWLADNAAGMVHRRLVGMPDDLAGLCKLRVGDYRILYWVYHPQAVVRIYRVQHRSEVYRHL
ncbi:MAG: type II toxin-antitoxin system RelE/ParE family toxin [Opitutus sp.]|nr:type II toxin-antitoxin system RelE/ParE family toxin [Opitutus sp.]